MNLLTNVNITEYISFNFSDIIYAFRLREGWYLSIDGLITVLEYNNLVHLCRVLLGLCIIQLILIGNIISIDKLPLHNKHLEQEEDAVPLSQPIELSGQAAEYWDDLQKYYLFIYISYSDILIT